jgi:N utilization substance protein A
MNNRGNDRVNLFDVIEELVEDRGIDRDVLSSVICEGLLAAYQRKYPELSLNATYNKKTGEVAISVEKEVVSASTDVLDEDAQVSLKKARYLDKDINVGDKIAMPFEGKIGRIEILRARQVIASKIRSVEAALVYEQFKDKEGTIVNGIIHKAERGGIIVKIGDTMAFLPKSLTIPGDKCIVGFSIRALLKEVLLEPRNDNQLILDRCSEDFLRILFELEIPEVFEKIVEIKKIVRAPGYKAKVIVSSRDKNIDPVGTCVGVGGSRIKPILKELSGEKIDIISWSDIPEIMVKGSLKPAEINRVEIVDQGHAQVWLDDDQRSVAIGKMGQNIALASKLVGMEIHLMQENSSVSKEQESIDGMQLPK